MLIAASQTVHSQEWRSNLKDAFKEASVSGKDVLLYFTVASNCETCTELEKNVLDTPQFKNFSRENYIGVKQDFKKPDSANLEENLLIIEKYNKDGFFPLVVIINRNEKIVGQLGTYNGETPQQYIAKLQSLRKS